MCLTMATWVRDREFGRFQAVLSRRHVGENARHGGQRAALFSTPGTDESPAPCRHAARCRATAPRQRCGWRRVGDHHMGNDAKRHGQFLAASDARPRDTAVGHRRHPTAASLRRSVGHRPPLFPLQHVRKVNRSVARTVRAHVGRLRRRASKPEAAICWPNHADRAAVRLPRRRPMFAESRIASRPAPAAVATAIPARAASRHAPWVRTRSALE